MRFKNLFYLLAALIFSLNCEAVECDKFPQNPHQSKFEPDLVKVKMGYVCQPTTTPITLLLRHDLQLRNNLFFWDTVGTSGPHTRLVDTSGARWNPNTLSAKAICIDGVYRSRLVRTAFSEDGVVIGSGTDTFPGVPVICNKSVGMIIDDTGSMSNEISAVKSVLSNYINSRDEEEYTVWQLTAFKDSARDFGVTTENSTILSWVNSLTASGGGDCPEDVLGGIQSSINALSSYSDHSKTLIVATDASAQQGDVSGIIAAAQANDVQVNVLLTGDCGATSAAFALSELKVVSSSSFLSSQVVLRQIAEETGGQYFYLPGGNQADFEQALTKIFESVNEPSDINPPNIEVQVSPEMVWPPNHKMKEIDVVVQAVDDTDPNPMVELVGITSTEPFDGQGDGNTENDINITEDGHILVRAERSGSGNDRIYTVTYKATDASGNFAFGSATIIVPHDHR